MGQIIRKNIITPFNILNLILGALVLTTGSIKNMLFLGVALCNTVVGCIQEIRAKQTIDKLSLISSPKAHVQRDGKLWEVPVARVVLDDILQLTSGNQVCSDCVVAAGSCEVNESLITGESDPVVKHPGDHLLSGSFIVSGTCRAQVEHVGKDNYAAKITGSAKYVKKPDSEIMR
ncbi:MAG TPA: ATPase P, partial [Ruminococcaceae bacterium]|nr:ATPase P [Oscillospiraceae bacterium]